ncbi:hypothetical protein D3C84_931610 [compost metagenome]
MIRRLYWVRKMSSCNCFSVSARALSYWVCSVLIRFCQMVFSSLPLAADSCCWIKAIYCSRRSLASDAVSAAKERVTSSRSLSVALALIPSVIALSNSRLPFASVTPDCAASASR